jgi:hypothetical protein
MKTTITRRSLFAAAGAAGLAPLAAQNQRDWSGKEPVRYPDPDVVVVDKRFSKYKVNNTAIERVYTGCLWAEGPAWSGQGQYLVWSDIPNHRQLRRLEEDGHVSTFRSDSKFSNGNTFDYEGRHQELISMIHPADVQWAAQRMQRLTDAQWRDAFRSANYSDADAERFIRRLKQKIDDGLALRARPVGHETR